MKPAEYLSVVASCTESSVAERIARHILKLSCLSSCSHLLRSIQYLFVYFLGNIRECYDFFEDLCTVKEISDMAQRLEAAKLLLDGSTYEQIVKTVEISTATISRINRCIQYGTGGYRQTIEKVREKQQ